MPCGYKSLTTQKIYYVTRQRSNATYDVIEQHDVPANPAVISDSVIRYNSLRSRQKRLPDDRQATYYDAETQKEYTFITNHFKLSAQTIADIYKKQRWQVEMFFKWIKQNLKIKSFLGTSQNAVMTQVWAAMCVHLLLAYLKFCNKVTASMQQISRLLAINLFAKRDSNKLIKAEPPPDDASFVQVALWYQTVGQQWVNLVLFGLAGPFLGRLMDVYGVKAITIMMIVIMTLGAGGSVLMQQPWQFYLLLGIVISAGSGGTSMIMGSAVVNRWFHKCRGLALGILGAAFSSGQLIFTPIIMNLNIHEGWHFSTLFIVILLALVALPLVMWLMTDIPGLKGMQPYRANWNIDTALRPDRNPMRVVMANRNSGYWPSVSVSTA